MSRVVKGGGWVAVAVYSKHGYYNFPTVQLYRRAFKALWPMFKHYPALAYSWFAAYAIRPFARIKGVGKAVRAVFPVVPLADPRWALLDTFDSITPSYQSAHDGPEVEHWLSMNGLQEVRQADWGRTSYRAVKLHA